MIAQRAVLTATRPLTAGAVDAVGAAQLALVAAPARRADACAVTWVALGAVQAVAALRAAGAVRTRRTGCKQHVITMQ